VLSTSMQTTRDAAGRENIQTLSDRTSDIRITRENVDHAGQPFVGVSMVVNAIQTKDECDDAE
jgi:hypothetical protein